MQQQQLQQPVQQKVLTAAPLATPVRKTQMTTQLFQSYLDENYLLILAVQTLKEQGQEDIYNYTGKIGSNVRFLAEAADNKLSDSPQQAVIFTYSNPPPPLQASQFVTAQQTIIQKSDDSGRNAGAPQQVKNVPTKIVLQQINKNNSQANLGDAQGNKGAPGGG